MFSKPNSRPYTFFNPDLHAPSTPPPIPPLDIDQDKLLSDLNLPKTRSTLDAELETYGPYRFTKADHQSLPEKYSYYNDTVGKFIRNTKERDAEVGKLSQFRKFLRNKRHDQELTALEASLAFGSDDEEDIERTQRRSDYEFSNSVKTVPLCLPTPCQIPPDDDLSWLQRAYRGQLPTRDREKKERIKEWDDMSKILIRQEMIDYITEKGKRYKGQAVRPKVNSWFTQQEYEKIIEQTGRPCRILFPARNADWTLEKKLYGGKSEFHNAVFCAKNEGDVKRRNWGYDNDLLYWPVNDKGYITKGNIDK